jgi:hypothetical protein
MLYSFTFVPVSFIIQFTRIMNIFYLINGILQTIPSIMINSWLASIIPLAFVVFMGMLREGLVDLKRRKEDNR